MSKFITEAKAQRRAQVTKSVTNYMGGTSYRVNPLDTLKMVSASSIFGEPQYYRDGKWKDATYKVDSLFSPYSILSEGLVGKKTSTIMEEVIDAALDFDFGGTLDWAIELRKDFYMRLNPQIIMVRAAMHPARVDFTAKYPLRFAEVEAQVMFRADEPATQLAYYLFKNGNKNELPSILKRAWARRIEKMSRYEASKYKNAELGLIDTIRVCHAKGALINELMQTGTIEVSENEERWERMRSEKRSWTEILNTIDLPHMALLRNLRGIFSEVNDIGLAKKIGNQLISGVAKGKQFPFRYYTAMQALEKEYGVNNKQILIDSLEGCIDEAAKLMPVLKGRTMCLSDNSGSAWGAFNSEFGSVTVAEIDNLSSVITASNSEEGYVGAFGDRLMVNSISKRQGILKQAQDISKNARGSGYSGRSGVGGSTENGVWIFFRDAIDKKEHWDNIFIYSDQQAGHGGLYSDNIGIRECQTRDFLCNGHYTDVAKLVKEYRNKVNPKVNVFSVQTAGYNNVCLPEYGYRTNLLYGWTGKELNFASEIIRQWDAIDTRERKGN